MKFQWVAVNSKGTTPQALYNTIACIQSKQHVNWTTILYQKKCIDNIEKKKQKKKKTQMVIFLYILYISVLIQHFEVYLNCVIYLKLSYCEICGIF